ncbi:hypothetical protein ILUMI_07372 [Ignelater luminosus]|uniref:MARVEL domain-containing protein n=1 Tax=Ignelater luminosus TaxID=2038154 RepID=A0A8K0D3P0_IGNLU|nr:hypothetical protein ILUMI_07372 [Ignelater luminosus]
MPTPENSVQRTTRSTTAASNIKVETNLRYDTSYVRRQGGVLKVLQILLSFVGFMCIQATYLSLSSIGKFFSTVSMLGVWITGILLVCYLYHVVEKYYNLPWIKLELFYCTVIAFCFLVAACMTAEVEDIAFQIAGSFGFFAMVAYGVDAYSKFVAMKSGALAQGGEKEISKETTRITTPTN